MVAVSHSPTNPDDTPVLKVCHNNGPREELFWAHPLLTQPHTDPRQTYIVMAAFRTCANSGLLSRVGKKRSCRPVNKNAKRKETC